MEIINRLRIGAGIIVEQNHELREIFTERNPLRRVAEADPGWCPFGFRLDAPGPVFDPAGVGWDEAVELPSRLRVQRAGG